MRGGRKRHLAALSQMSDAFSAGEIPTISLFFGIIIRMYYDDHAPPHFHAYYQEHSALILIATLEVRDGRLPRRAMAMVLEWAALHGQELLTDWALAAEHKPLRQIDPLE